MLMRWTGAVCVTLLSLTAHGSERIPFCRCHRFPVCAASSFLSSAPRFGGTITKQKLVCQLARLCTTFSEPGAPVVIPKNGTGANSTAFYSITRTLSRAFRISTACMQTGHSLGRKTTSRTRVVLIRNQVEMTQSSAPSCSSWQSCEIKRSNTALGAIALNYHCRSLHGHAQGQSGTRVSFRADKPCVESVL